ncbi:hypothetical protein GRO01_09400 [Gluconobacter roseus NBRC 3990]|uniref:Uncharacterized protein n=1 Tax=Gluconobacter roseus NBRC 3990 TaxID=1307950 RepID=A0A4Y3M424_9PROT|nr:hypothetical protein AA3990_2047 [Gluconobacter roseus NBRC 3990]GEB03364.1 hypothetical protein GRO01_09400 [Gluconobacter roseus NBRC 3990]GLP93822.1 hypothetical protein GCM10007871_18000 [Gluconobacter roseus NBRC 3990]
MVERVSAAGAARKFRSCEGSDSLVRLRHGALNGIFDLGWIALDSAFLGLGRRLVIPNLDVIDALRTAVCAPDYII